jgi:hypothetical protein
MPDETDLSSERKWLGDSLAAAAVNSLRRNNLNADYFASRGDALTAVMRLIPDGAKVVRGDSVTVDQLGIVEHLNERQIEVLDPMLRKPDGTFLVADVRARRDIARQAFTSDVFLTGTNAITLDGKLVNTDAWGNRVAALIFGPDKVIVLAGVNKIVKDVDEALGRIRSVAAPLNVRRHLTKHQRTEFGDIPCARSGVCSNCRHDWRLCRHVVITEGAMIREKGRINVIIVGEDLGI